MAKSTTTPVNPAATPGADNPEVPQSGSIASTPESTTTPVNPAATPGADTGGENYADNMVHLVKENEKGEVVDTMALPIGAWNNLSESHRSEWKVKKPDSIN